MLNLEWHAIGDSLPCFLSINLKKYGLIVVVDTLAKKSDYLAMQISNCSQNLPILSYKLLGQIIRMQYFLVSTTIIINQFQYNSAFLCDAVCEYIRPWFMYVSIY